MGTVTDTYGNAIRGCVPGLASHLGGGAKLLFISGNPDGLIYPNQPQTDPSGAVVAYDYQDDQYYLNETGSTWYKLGSVE